MCLFGSLSGSLRAQINQRLQDSTNVVATHIQQKNKFLKASIAPAALILSGTYFSFSNNNLRFKIREERNNYFTNFHTEADNYLAHAPAAILYGLNLVGVKGEHDFINRTVILIKIELLMTALTFPTKELTHVTRPDGSDQKSFPSGHTAQAFAMATFMAKEYSKQSVWYSVGAYTMATAVGTMRILNNRHWISDVLAGAGIGILSTEIVYLTHQNNWGKKNRNGQTFILPSYDGHSGLICMVHHFK